MGKEALHQLYDESMPIKQVVVTLISRRKSNVLRIIDPELVSKIVEFLQQRYRKVD
jgi:hypothetical protein